jgi:hypothetical protein
MLTKLLVLTLLLALPMLSVGQTYHSSNNFFFLPQVPVKAFQGRPYRYQVSIRYVPADTTARVSLKAMQVGKGEYDFKQQDALTERVLPQQWHSYTIQGQIGAGVEKLWFYCMVSGNGTFFFDNLTLQVQQPNQAWQTVPIKNGDFEHSATPLAGYEMGRKTCRRG